MRCCSRYKSFLHKSISPHNYCFIWTSENLFEFLQKILIPLLSFYKPLKLYFSISFGWIEIYQSKEIFLLSNYFFFVLLVYESSEIFFQHFLDFEHIHYFVVNSVKGVCLKFFFFTVECSIFAQEIICLSAILHGFRFLIVYFSVFVH